MGELTRNFNWSQTVIGSPGEWPQSLRTTVSNLLRSKFPMFLWWGPDMIQFYNDAYRPSLGNNGKHPYALGQNGKECWPEIWDIISPLHRQVQTTGEATWMEDQLVPIYRNGKIEDVYWTYSYSSVLDDEGNHAGILVTCNETTEKVNTFNKLLNSEQRFHNLVSEATIGIVVLIGAEMRVEVVNEAYGKLLNRTVDELKGKNLFDLIPEAADPFRQLLDNVRNTGETLYLYDQGYSVDSKAGTINGYLNLVYQPYREADGTISGILALCQDVTEQVNARKKIEEARQDLQHTILNAPIGICVLDAATLVSEIINDSFVQVAGKPYEAIKGKMYWETFAEAKPYYEAALDGVIKHGKTFYANEVELMMIRHGKEEMMYVTFVYEPLKDEDGNVKKVVVWVIENTQQVASRKKAEESAQQVKALVESAPFPIGVYIGREMKIEFANQSIIEVWGKGPEVIGKRYADILPELENQQIYSQLDGVYTTGIPFHARNQRVDIEINSKLKPFYFNYSFTPLLDASGQVYGVMNTAADVTDLNEAKQQVEQSEKNFRSMILQAPVAMCILLGPGHVVDIANDAMIQIWGKPAEVVMHKPIFEGLPDAKEQGLEAMLHGVYCSGEPFRADERPVQLLRNGRLDTVYQNFVYEPYRDSDGKTLGVLAISIDVTEQVLARQKIEEVVQLRTMELAQANDELIRTNQELSRSNANLEEFAYAASHDLKEPVRKIHFFSDRLRTNLSEVMKEEDFKSFSRLEVAARRMNSLIEDLLAYSQVNLKPATLETVDLNEVMDIVLSELDLEIEQKDAKIRSDRLCTVQGHKRQLQQAFQNLLTNALKYSSPERTPVIEVKSARVAGKDVELHISPEAVEKEYCLIEVRDNGIGFDNSEAERIFNVFTRLGGSSETRGTGVGLSIVRKVVENHKGFVVAKGKPREGAVFKVYLPL